MVPTMRPAPREKSAPKPSPVILSALAQLGLERLLRLRAEVRALPWWRVGRRYDLRVEIDATLDSIARIADTDGSLVEVDDTLDSEGEGPC